jgi:hypothetical protein
MFDNDRARTSGASDNDAQTTMSVDVSKFIKNPKPMSRVVAALAFSVERLHPLKDGNEARMDAMKFVLAIESVRLSFGCFVGPPAPKRDDRERVVSVRHVTISNDQRMDQVIQGVPGVPEGVPGGKAYVWRRRFADMKHKVITRSSWFEVSRDFYGIVVLELLNSILEVVEVMVSPVNLLKRRGPFNHEGYSQVLAPRMGYRPVSVRSCA